MTASIIIEARNLSKHFVSRGSLLFGAKTTVRAVDGVSFAVRSGETFAIVGESGCGKSTLARLLLRLIEPTAGDVIFQGQTVTKFRGEALRALRRDMQMVFQDPYASLNPRMSAGALVGEPLGVHGIASGEKRKARVTQLLRLAGLRPEHAERYPHEFSGGQRQRIGIARALASGPKLIIGDEPVSALDVSIRAQIINLLEELKARLGLTLILVSHDLGVVRHAADRVAVMYLGEIVELANAEQLFQRPLHPYTRALMAAIPAPVPAARRARALLDGDPPSPANPPPGCRFHTRCPHVQEICRRERPPLAEASSGHVSACHFTAALLLDQAKGLAPPPESDAKLLRLKLFSAAQLKTGPAQLPSNGSKP